MASLKRMCNPSSLKNLPMPIGDTAIGRKLKKYLLVSKGEKNATPNPPLVIASRTPCDAVHRKRYNHIPAIVTFGLLRYHATASTALNRTANSKEWVRPRCPHTSPY